MSLKDKTAIAGIGLTEFSKNSGVSELSLAAQCIVAACDDAGIDPSGASGQWYRETGSGMGATLNAAVGMNAYTMTDRGTWISFRNKGDYDILVEGDDDLFNQYGVILVNPEKHARVKAAAGQAFIDWILGPEGQAAIAGYTLDGQQLFFPNAPATMDDAA